jgi:pteridine reductase
MDLRGRVALVTGGAVRVGGAIALAFARAGARVVIHYHSSAGPATELAERIRGEGGEAATSRADLRTHAGVERLAEAALEPFGPVDVLVNNASVFPPERFAEVSFELWEETLAVNLRAPFFLTQFLGVAMKERGGGLVVNLGDLSGMQAWKGWAAHGIAKGGLLHLTRVAARALAPEVRVVAIAPGAVLPPEDTPAEVTRGLAAKAPLQRIGSPDDVADAVLYLARADFVTGETLVVDGGWLLR